MITLTVIFSIAGLLLLSAAARAITDSMAHHNAFKKKGLWWDGEESWRWKYKGDWHENVPKFWGSTTIFVAFTDAWHFFCMVRDTSWQVALVLLLPISWHWVIPTFIVGKAIYSGIFQVLYTVFNKQV